MFIEVQRVTATSNRQPAIVLYLPH